MSNPEKKNRHLNLFPKKKTLKKKVDDKAFDLMTAAADKTNVDVLAKGKESSTKGIHNALLAAGMTPGLGNIADVADATLYALEGEFGEAAWSAAAAIPVIGQMVSGKRALKAAKEAGEEMVTLYRGIPDWFSGKMVKKGKFVSPKETGIWAGNTKESVRGYRGTHTDIGGGKMGAYNPQTGKLRKPATLEFEVPKSWFNKNAKVDFIEGKDIEYWIEGGIPKEFLKKVHK